MDDYLVGLISLAFAVFLLSIIQLKDRRYGRLQDEHQRLQVDMEGLNDRLKVKEKDLDQMQRRSISLLKWKSRAEDLEEELKVMKQTQDYISASRLKYLEEYIDHASRRDKSMRFVETFHSKGRHTFEDGLSRMLEGAKFEIIIASPWIKRQMWDRIKGPLKKFARRGGSIKVFMRGCESDFAAGLSDDIVQEVEDLGGEVILIRQLHAKLYVADRKEAIIASANLTRGGLEGNYEAGVWLNDPLVMKDIGLFLEDLYQMR